MFVSILYLWISCVSDGKLDQQFFLDDIRTFGWCYQ